MTEVKSVMKNQKKKGGEHTAHGKRYKGKASRKVYEFEDWLKKRNATEDVENVVDVVLPPKMFIMNAASPTVNDSTIIPSLKENKISNRLRGESESAWTNPKTGQSIIFVETAKNVDKLVSTIEFIPE